MFRTVPLAVGIVLAGLTCWADAPPVELKPWTRHVIDDTSRGADGVRLADVNGDKRQDIVTGWEEGGLTRIYLNPGRNFVKMPWPAITVGNTPNVEDAVIVDLDGDGASDVVTCCEGKTKCVFVHWAPKEPARYRDATAWTTEAIPLTKGMTAWIYALPMQVDGRSGIDLMGGSKGEGAVVGWLESPANPRRLADWKFHKLYNAGWIMSLIPVDMNADGRTDVVITDRKGKNSGVLWLENPGFEKVAAPWPEHRIGATGRQVMFADVADLDGDGKPEMLAAVKPNEIHMFTAPANPKAAWKSKILQVQFPAGIGTAKAVRAADLDGDGKTDLVYSCEDATGMKLGVVWLRAGKNPHDGDWIVQDVSGPDGIKYDRIELIDMDEDGDLDVLLCEERQQQKGLGVIWYENPGQPR